MFTFLHHKADGSLTPLDVLVPTSRARSVPAAELIDRLRTEYAPKAVA